MLELRARAAFSLTWRRLVMRPGGTGGSPTFDRNLACVGEYFLSLNGGDTHLITWGGGEPDRICREPAEGGREEHDKELGSLGTEDSPRDGNGYSNLFAFASNGVPMMGVGECNGTGMIVVGGFVLDRYDIFTTKK